MLRQQLESASVIVFSAILSNTASEVGYVLLVPLGAIIFLAGP
ncbi:MAG: AbgT family transporter [Draconibacterium sp.]